MPSRRGARHDSRAPRRQRCQTCALLSTTLNLTMTHAAETRDKRTRAAQHVH